MGISKLWITLKHNLKTKLYDYLKRFLTLLKENEHLWKYFKKKIVNWADMIN